MFAEKINKTFEEVYTVRPGKNAAGDHIFSLLLKRTYDIQPHSPAKRSERFESLIENDIYYDNGDPQWACVKYESDLAPYKIATDVVLIGKAYAPDGKPVNMLDAVIEIGENQKVVRVIGDRKCIYGNPEPLFTEPAAFRQMELRYEKAYGGWDRNSDPDMPFAYPRNPLGTGIAIKNIPEVIDGLVLPNLEDPKDLLTPERIVMGEANAWNRQPLPQGFGWFQKTWYPRCSFVGAVPGFVDIDEVMREEALGLVPQNQIALARQFKLPGFDVRFNNGASLGLSLPYLSGDETIRLKHLTPDGDFSFVLPGETPCLMMDIGLGEKELTPVLHTVCIRMEDMQVDLVWRGAHTYPGVDWLPEMKKLETAIC